MFFTNFLLSWRGTRSKIWRVLEVNVINLTFLLLEPNLCFKIFFNLTFGKYTSLNMLFIKIKNIEDEYFYSIREIIVVSYVRWLILWYTYVWVWLRIFYTIIRRLIGCWVLFLSCVQNHDFSVILSSSLIIMSKSIRDRLK